MTLTIRQNMSYFRLLDNSKGQQTKIIIQASTSDHIKALLEIFFNIQLKNIQLNPSLERTFKRKLKLFKNIFGKNTNKTSAVKKMLVSSHKFVKKVIHEVLPHLNNGS